MPQSKLVPILAAVRSLFTRFYGTVPDLTDLSSIVLMSQELHGYTHEMILDLTRSDGHPWITETVNDIPIDDGWLDEPVTWLNEAGADEVVFEYEHGDARVKQNLNMLLDTVKPGDTIITLEVSRLSRSTMQLCELIETISAKKLRLMIVGSITVDCRNGECDPMTKAFIQLSGIFAELELSMIRARVKSGMQNAKAKGKQIGRKPITKDDISAAFYKHYPAYAAGKMNVSELARVCGLSRPTVYKYLRMFG